MAVKYKLSHEVYVLELTRDEAEILSRALNSDSLHIQYRGSYGHIILSGDELALLKRRLDFFITMLEGIRVRIFPEFNDYY